MKYRSYATRLLLAAVICAAALAIHFGIEYRKPNAFHGYDLWYAALFVSVCLGWVGLAELRRLGMRRTVAAIRLCVIVLALPVLVMPNAFSFTPLIAASLLMLGACVIAFWQHHRS